MRFIYDTIFLRVGFTGDFDNIEKIEFFIQPEKEKYYGFQYELDAEYNLNSSQMIYINKETILNLIQDYSENSDIEKIRQKYYNLVLFK